MDEYKVHEILPHQTHRGLEGDGHSKAMVCRSTRSWTSCATSPRGSRGERRDGLPRLEDPPLRAVLVCGSR